MMLDAHILKIIIKLPSMIVHACNSSTSEIGAGASEIEGQLQIHGEFKTSLSCMRLQDPV